MRRLIVLAGMVTALGIVGQLHAQAYSVRLRTRLQSVDFRGVALDSISLTDVVVGPAGGLQTQDGFAVRCLPGRSWCTFFRPGEIRRGGPAVITADMSLWGLGVPGLRIQTNVRLGFDVGDSGAWPGTDPAVQLLYGYAEYASRGVTVQLGRTHVVSRFGFQGFDGAKVNARALSRRLTVTAFGGWALARGTALPVTSPALNPLGDFQPGKRHLVWGAGATWSSAHVAGRARYQREIDSRTRDISSERLALDGVIRPGGGVSLSGGADYDLAAGFWGSAEGMLSYAGFGGKGLVSAGVRRYRPHFDLWTIWGAFSPVPYRAAFGVLAVRPLSGMEVRARGEVYEFDESGAATPLATVEDDGWRWSVDGTYSRLAHWIFDLGLHRELGPGAGSVGYQAGATFLPATRWSVSTQASLLERPLEFRFDDAKLWTFGANVHYRPSDRLRLGLSATRYDEARRRPDAAQFEWNQLRLHFDATLFLSSAAGPALHPAILRIPERRGPR